MKRKKKVLIIICVVLILLVTVVPFAVAGILYESVFDRYQTGEPYLRDISEFPNLQVENISFDSKEGNRLAGYIYTDQNVDSYDGIVIFAHGMGGGGQNSYMHIAEFFTANGFLVFAYDVTGNDNSEGKTIRGIPQGLEDLEQAINYVETDQRLKNYPICLFGHSWGGYSVANVLNFHPEVKAVVSGAGFNSSTDMIDPVGRQMLGAGMDIFLPYVKLYEKVKFGKYSGTTGIDGFANTDAKVVVIQSRDDNTILPQYGYDKYYAKFQKDERFRFYLFEDRGHNFVFFSDEALAYIEQYNKEFSAYFEEHEFTPEAKLEYNKQHFDKMQGFALDEELFADILEVFRESVR